MEARSDGDGEDEGGGGEVFEGRAVGSGVCITLMDTIDVNKKYADNCVSAGKFLNNRERFDGFSRCDVWGVIWTGKRACDVFNRLNSLKLKEGWERCILLFFDLIQGLLDYLGVKLHVRWRKSNGGRGTYDSPEDVRIGSAKVRWECSSTTST